MKIRTNEGEIVLDPCMVQIVSSRILVDSRRIHHYIRQRKASASKWGIVFERGFNTVLRAHDAKRCSLMYNGENLTETPAHEASYTRYPNS